MNDWRRWQYAFLDLVFPPTCAACEKPTRIGEPLCMACTAEVRYLEAPLCGRCGTAFASAGGSHHLCGRCLTAPPPFELARGIAFYAPPVSTLLQRLKFGGDKTVLAALGQIASGFDFAAFSSCDVIIPVPLHPRRLRERGLNQALLLADLFFPMRPTAVCPDILCRTRDTVPQTCLNGKERRRNLKQAFRLRRGKGVGGMTVCLVDDIFTTGTTVYECAATLLRGGAMAVKVVTMARVPEQRLDWRR